jgi:RNA-directed DNA polymerase
LSFEAKGYRFVLKTDIKSYFPNIDKKKLRRIFFTHVKDVGLRSYFVKYLNQSLPSGAMPGIPQGTPLSPFCANLFLLSFDKYLTSKRNIRHFRYIDDLVVFCKNKNSAIRIFSTVQEYYKNIGLEVHPMNTEGKTVVGRFTEGSIDIVGVINNHGRILVKPKKYKEFLTETINPIKDKKILNKNFSLDAAIRDLIKDLKYKIAGWSGAYGFCDFNRQELNLKIRNNFEILFKDLNLPEQEKVSYRKLLPTFKLKK